MKIEYEIVKKIKSLEKPFITIPDLAKLLEKKRGNIYLIAHRLIKAKILKIIHPGIYVLPDKHVNYSYIANQLYKPSYLSFEWVLGNVGILNQIPYTLTFAATRKSKTIILKDNQEVQYHQLKKELFFGYDLIDDVYYAQPEKALLDQLYMVSKGKSTLDFEELNLKGLKKTLFLQYAKKYPKPTQKLAQKLAKDFRKISITVK